MGAILHIRCVKPYFISWVAVFAKPSKYFWLPKVANWYGSEMGIICNS